MPSDVFKSKRHDTAVAPRMTLTPPAGFGRSLQDPGTTVKFIARLPQPGSTPKINAPAAVVGPWEIEYAPVPADVDTIGTYDVEAEALWSDGKKLTLPTVGYLSWVIEADLDDA